MIYDEFISVLVMVIVLFCVSGMGIYGSLDFGMIGDSMILIFKFVFDFFIVVIFVCNLGYVVFVVVIF